MLEFKSNCWYHKFGSCFIIQDGNNLSHKVIVNDLIELHKNLTVKIIQPNSPTIYIEQIKNKFIPVSLKNIIIDEETLNIIINFLFNYVLILLKNDTSLSIIFKNNNLEENVCFDKQNFERFLDNIIYDGEYINILNSHNLVDINVLNLKKNKKKIIINHIEFIFKFLKYFIFDDKKFKKNINIYNNEYINNLYKLFNIKSKIKITIKYILKLIMESEIIYNDCKEEINSFLNKEK